MGIQAIKTETIQLGDNLGNQAFVKSITGLQYSGVNSSYQAGQLLGVAPPAQPVCTPGTGGSMVAGNYLVKITYVNAPQGESLPSAESVSETVASSGTLVVTSPSASSPATGYNVYITAAGGSTGTETKQNATPIAIGTNYTQSAAVTSGAALPATNSTLTWNPTFPVTPAQFGYVRNVSAVNGPSLAVSWTAQGGGSLKVLDLVPEAEISFCEVSAGAGIGGITAMAIVASAVQAGVEIVLVG
ncbi:MAG TPA: hypothetical protein VG206_02805 [Terriglobia bacterium]|nr:hypothetical protein [Terriglobia bacterium]